MGIPMIMLLSLLLPLIRLFFVAMWHNCALDYLNKIHSKFINWNCGILEISYFLICFCVFRECIKFIKLEVLVV